MTRARISITDLISPLKCRLPKNDITGMKFNKLMVIGFAGRKNRKSYYKCICDCGNAVIVYQRNIVSGKTKSCGCYQAEKNWSVHFVDVTGKRWGKLVAVGFFKRINRRTFWIMQCDCGNVKNIALENLLSGNVNSCGCIKRERMSSRGGKNHHLWRGGKSSKYPKEWTERLKEEIRNRDNRTCQFPKCDYTDVFEYKKLDVHHIDEDKLNCKQSNLISLCHAHHKVVQLKNNEWVEYFYNITDSYRV